MLFESKYSFKRAYGHYPTHYLVIYDNDLTRSFHGKVGDDKEPAPGTAKVFYGKFYEVLNQYNKLIK